MSLLPAPIRIPARMSATTLPLTLERSAYLSSTLNMDDANAVAYGLKRRDPELLDHLIEKYQYRLYRYLLHITANKERSEDFFQETWIRVLERGHQFNGSSRFEPWLFTIARNLVLDWQRQKKMQSLDSLLAPESGEPLQLPQ